MNWIGHWFGQWFGDGDSPPGAMAGTATITLSANAELLALGAMSGAAELTIGGTGDLSVFGAFSETTYEGGTSGAGYDDDDELLEIAAMLIASGALEQPTKATRWLR